MPKLYQNLGIKQIKVKEFSGEAPHGRGASFLILGQALGLIKPSACPLLHKEALKPHTRL